MERSSRVLLRPSVRPSICPYPEKRNHSSFVNVSPTLVIDTSMEGLHEYYTMEIPKLDFFLEKSSKFEFWLSTNSWNHHSFVNISPTLDFSNWYINGMVFTSTTPWTPQNLFFSKKFEFWFLTKSWNHLSFVNISPTLVIDASMEWSSRVLHHGNPKIEFFSKSWKSTKLNSVRTSTFRTQRKEIALALSIPVLHKKLIRQRKGLHEYYNMGTKNLIFFSRRFEIEFD